MATHTKLTVDELLDASANLARMEAEARRFVEIIQAPLFRRMRRNKDYRYDVLFTPFESLEVPPGHACFRLFDADDGRIIKVQVGKVTVDWFIADGCGTRFNALPFRLIRPVREHLHDLLQYMELGAGPADSDLSDLVRYGKP